MISPLLKVQFNHCYFNIYRILDFYFGIPVSGWSILLIGINDDLYSAGSGGLYLAYIGLQNADNYGR